MLTDVILLAVLLLLLVLEIYAMSGRASLITARVRYYSGLYKIIPFLAGLLCGHFWWCG